MADFFKVLKNDLTIAYFIFFILINVFDFLGLLSGDMDFFKKILSWTLIWILFYKASFSRIFFGKRKPLIDIAYIILFCIFTIPRLLSYYFSLDNSFSLFSNIILYLNKILLNVDFQSLFFISLFFLFIFNITILENIKIEKNSFLGSLDLKDSFFKKIYLHLSLFFITIFFSLIIVPFFLEWFALSVDSIILVLGLVYYGLVFFNKKLENKNNLLNKISNTGNSFFLYLVDSFSDRRKLFVGVSFLLTLHLLVDFGVYMIPNIFGNFSTLYGENILRESIFNIFSFKESIYFKEIVFVFSNFSLNFFSKFIYAIISFIFYLLYFVYFSLLLVMPFYLIYKSISRIKVNLRNFISVFLVSMTILSFIVLFFFSYVQIPFKISKIDQSTGISGVEIISQPIVKIPKVEEDLGSSFMNINLFRDYISLFLFLIFFIFLFNFLIGRDSGKYVVELSYVIIVLFFIFYIFSYFSSINQNNFNLFSIGMGSFGTEVDSFQVSNENIIQGNRVIFQVDGVSFEGRLYSSKYPEETFFLGIVKKRSERILDKFFASNLVFTKNISNLNDFVFGSSNLAEVKVILSEDFIPEISSKQEQKEILDSINFQEVEIGGNKSISVIIIQGLLLFFSSLFYLVGLLAYVVNLKKDFN